MRSDRVESEGERMKRIDDLTGATIQRVEVSRSGIMHIWLDKRRNADGSWAGNVEWRPLRVAIPKEARRKGQARRRAKED